ncbi:hypothetical protein AJ85_17420 [Alkalihalobacillus alcalophilus ATCC 27647 = CGMCC 1.3604]|uniref:Enoyl-CoA hydratase n=1 Tax=Alkalihalobacillus alcalophilus ATCC 27647 = CGMCC 1.3604 TaxID=1218173 RepID=A0A094WSL2_ALKAL|nr:enoyl-CoA hydratase-related protein [Alkalihalobacillus alcalophilus]KGA99068.1 hypothetical protein BALCAV_0201155 [Alkalihalobacillus alcalophilus ATCC 27647 = CGMCC 1.3604]MED1560713.1 enoyl-CoA hydratase-related protein [Alkalihalobacillus alcalophilus]THG89482.1 hypothetical protein AJ85_17420 [Alkalihalobacillus alcalophilus ATCC 27647 = CGMCC 1.3604]
MSESVLVEKNNEIATIYLNEPDSLNAMGLKLIKELTTVLRELEEDRSIKVVILAGKGKSFCAGGDIKMMANEDLTLLKTKEVIDDFTGIVATMRKMTKVIIAAVHGYVAGAGMSLALAADLIVAEEDSRFVLSFKNIALIPDLGIHYHLPKVVGELKAKEWIMRGVNLTAQDAKAERLVSEVVAKGALLETANGLAAEIASGPTQAFVSSKRIIHDSFDSSFEEVIEKENAAQIIMRGTDDHREGIQAFFEKRRPKFSGK